MTERPIEELVWLAGEFSRPPLTPEQRANLRARLESERTEAPPLLTIVTHDGRNGGGRAGSSGFGSNSETAGQRPNRAHAGSARNNPS